jgi:hypothetical protein
MTFKAASGESNVRVSGTHLLSLYTRCLLWYALGVWLLWKLGAEGIYAHPTPFYALWQPSFDHLAWHGLALGSFALAFAAWWAVMARLRWFEQDLPPRAVAWMLVALVAYVFIFSAAVAMMRGGPAAISAAYERQTYEYIGDIGKVSSIRKLFQDYVTIHPHLSMHAKVHPPGPIALLWLMSYAIGQDPMTLSIATMFFGSLAVIPLYLWVRDMTTQRVALTSCLLYTLMPAIVLFTATSADILFMPFTVTTLFLFWRALHRKSLAYAAAAGALYGVLSFLSFSLISIGAFFGFIGLWRLRDKDLRFAVVQTAVAMIVTFLAVHGAVWLWSEFDVVGCFRLCKAQFDMDQKHLDMVTPRFPWWAWRIFNPLCWFLFAGIPVSVLFIWRLARPREDKRSLFLSILLTFCVMSLLYLARGEGERSAMYVLPFVVVPAAHLLDQMGNEAQSRWPLGATMVFLAIQCWLIEALLYTYW